MARTPGLLVEETEATTEGEGSEVGRPGAAAATEAHERWGCATGALDLAAELGADHCGLSVTKVAAAERLVLLGLVLGRWRAPAEMKDRTVWRALAK